MQQTHCLWQPQLTSSAAETQAVSGDTGISSSAVDGKGSRILWQLSLPKLRQQEFATWIFLPWTLLLILAHSHPSWVPMFGRWRHETGIQHCKWSSSRSNISSLNCSSLKADICNWRTWWINTTAKSIYGLAEFIQQSPFGPGHKAWYLKSIFHFYLLNVSIIFYMVWGSAVPFSSWHVVGWPSKEWYQVEVELNEV